MHMSFWERESWFADRDVAVVGGGIVGLCAALALQRARPAWKILVVERGALPSGASTRNAGFACIGSVAELVEDLQHHSLDTIAGLIERRWHGLARLRELLGDEAIGYEACGSHELFLPHEHDWYAACLAQLPLLNQTMRAVTGIDEVFYSADDARDPFGFAGVAHLIGNRAEGALHTGRMMQALIRRVREAGVEIITGLPLVRLEDRGDAVRLHTSDSAQGGSASGGGWDFAARRVLVATNGFARQLLPALPVEPARSQVVVTAPIPNLRFRGTFHMERGYTYFRTIGDRVLLGGGRHLDFAGEATDHMDTTPRIQSYLEELLHTTILPGTPVEITDRWSGIMGLGPEKVPIVRMVSPNVACAVRMGGMGVAIGALVGEEGAQLLL